MMRKEKSRELSKYLFGEELSENIKEQLESYKITRHVVVGEEKSKCKLVDATHRKPFSYKRRSQKGTAFNKSVQTQTATKQ